MSLRWARLVDEPSFEDWIGYFEEFSEAFTKAGVPINPLIRLIDGKLWKIARPGKFQKVIR